MKIIKIILAIITSTFLIIIALGIYKFNFTDDDIIISDEQGICTGLSEMDCAKKDECESYYKGVPCGGKELCPSVADFKCVKK